MTVVQFINLRMSKSYTDSILLLLQVKVPIDKPYPVYKEVKVPIHKEVPYPVKEFVHYPVKHDHHHEHHHSSHEDYGYH